MSFQFRSRVIVTGQLVFQSGDIAELDEREDFDEIPDLSVIRDITGLWYISGSSMKRLLRARAREVVMSRIGPAHACDHYRKGAECIRTGEAPGAGIHIKEMLAQNRWSDEHLKTAIEYFSCLVCSLFGSQLLDTRVAVEDLRPAVYAQSRVRGKDQHESLDGKNFVFRAMLTDCDEWHRGLFLSALSRLQTKTLRVSCGGLHQHARATLEVTDIRALESAREYLETLDASSEQRDGHTINMVQLQAWHSALSARLREVEADQLRQTATASAS